MRHGLAAVLAGLPCGLLLALAGYWLSLNSLAQNLHAQLATALPQRVVESGINLGELDYLHRYLQQNINADLAQLRPASMLSPVSACRAELLQLRGTPFTLDFNPERYLQLTWTQAEKDASLTLGLQCQKNWLVLGLPLALAMLAAAAIGQLLPPLPALQRQCLDRLLAQGVSRRAALDWWPTALDYCNGNLVQALAICNSPPQLSFDAQRSTVLIHGMAIKLPATPFFYYLWYAQLRSSQSDDGWFINPPSNRPDRQHDQALIDLMLSHDGHHKAINDLRDKGLRAKTLDQNRSKVKDELLRVLGETLARPYLFDMARDPGTARFKYRLALAPAYIQL